MAKADVYIISHVNAGGHLEYLVRPSFVVLDGKGARKFRVRNLTDTDDTWVDLRNNEEPGTPARAQVFKNPNYAATLTVKKLVGSAEYSVTVGGVPAKGESDPVIIIDPPAS